MSLAKISESIHSFKYRYYQYITCLSIIKCLRHTYSEKYIPGNCNVNVFLLFGIYKSFWLYNQPSYHDCYYSNRFGLHKITDDFVIEIFYRFPLKLSK